ncbi:uncharacterized protein LOC129764449 [Toxorhynchites rutilus septentrionalis]|uniref:uncharacterized protein LOC129764449 n=1 Tax=Toxorhynchites rutilus septentrionalis TaxID=329112 RepID=UPI002479FB27|nr:uncharacterized protein LOC129764449 [Toxorhynchites rutilus septentrionalis]
MTAIFTSVLVTGALFVFVLQLHGVPLPAAEEDGIHPLNTLFQAIANNSIEESETNNSTNGTAQDLYVIKAVVYEIGILVDRPDNASEEIDDEQISEQQVDLTFFSSGSNKTHINLGDIPLPVSTSVNGQVLTGIAPVHIGAISNLTDLLTTLPITGTIVNITQTNSSFIELTRQNISDISDPTSSIVNAADLANLPIETVSNPLVPSSLDQTITKLATGGTF